MRAKGIILDFYGRESSGDVWYISLHFRGACDRIQGKKRAVNAEKD